MAVCSKCGQRIGVFKKSYRLGPEKTRFCEACAETWHQEDKERLLAPLYAGGKPKELFCIHRVMMVDPYDRTQKLGGDLIFTDKGICFAAVLKYKPPSQVAAHVGRCDRRPHQAGGREEGPEEGVGGGARRRSDTAHR